MNDVITTVVFDIGNVLIEWNPEHLYRRLIPDTAERTDFLQNVCNMNWNLQQDLGRSWAEAVDTLCVLHPDKADLIAAYSDRWHEMIPGEVAGTRQILQELQETDIPLFAVTNFSNEKFAECLVRFPFLKTSFVDIVVSAEERLIKPDPRIYQVLFERNGLKPGACFFIDDSEANVEAARKVGMEAHHFLEASTLRQDLCKRGLLAN
ncbi:HAD family phosphatase [uncultured Roseibium sp.]|uniref:HAD family hydrolase n=1 Tax=uncultured Roseibium sp. TaxID=1936171 RepID=UPI00262818CE|nr:HAD family phosphatase [uncultured Roseibium sp.]